MPTYQYKCPECGHEFEQYQSMKDAAIEICPSCGGKTRRLISGGAGLIFKGSGFYITDYRSDSYKKSAKADSEKSPSSSSSPSGSSSGGGGSGGGAGAGATPKTESKPSPTRPPTKSSGDPRKGKS